MDNVNFAECDLRKTQFSFAAFNSINFASSKIDGIKLNPESLSGVTVDYNQAAYLGTKLLGLKLNS